MPSAPNNPAPSSNEPRPGGALPGNVLVVDTRERPVRIALEQGGFLGRWGTRLPWILFVLALLSAIGMHQQYQSYMQTDPLIEEKFFSHSETATDKVAIITIEGSIMHNDGFAKWQIDHVRKDPHVKAVVVRVDSPGGTVTGSDYLYHHLKMLREGDRKLPLVVSMGGIAASGGYYISMAAGDVPDTIFAERSTWTGSIGVIIPLYNVADLLKRWNIEDDSVTSGPLKAMGSPTQKLTPEEKAVFKTLVEQTFEQFKDVVAAARPKLAADSDKFKEATTGQIFTAKQALDLGLVDRLGFVEDAVDRAIELGKLDAARVRVVKYKKQKGLLDDALFGSSAQSQAGLANVLDLASPRAYFLWTWLPAAIKSGSP